MSEFRVVKQADAEKDIHLVECFYDAGFIKNLIDNQYSIVAGRKGSGKTALARYLEKKSEQYGIHFSQRISMRNVTDTGDANERGTLASFQFYILIKTIRSLIEQDIFDEESKTYWNDFLYQNGVQNVSTYETFRETRRTDGLKFKISAKFQSWIASLKGGVESDAVSEKVKPPITSSPDFLLTFPH